VRALRVMHEGKFRHLPVVELRPAARDRVGARCARRRPDRAALGTSSSARRCASSRDARVRSPPRQAAGSGGGSSFAVHPGRPTAGQAPRRPLGDVLGRALGRVRRTRRARHALRRSARRLPSQASSTTRRDRRSGRGDDDRPARRTAATSPRRSPAGRRVGEEHRPAVTRGSRTRATTCRRRRRPRRRGTGSKRVARPRCTSRPRTASRARRSSRRSASRCGCSLTTRRQPCGSAATNDGESGKNDELPIASRQSARRGACARWPRPVEPDGAACRGTTPVADDGSRAHSSRHDEMCR
jgi:hypothetical protein